MKKKPIWALRWGLPVVCLLFALFFYTAIPGFSFSGLMSLGICGILLCYNFFTLLSPRFPKPVKLGPKTTAWRVEDIVALIERIGSSSNEMDSFKPI